MIRAVFLAALVYALGGSVARAFSDPALFAAPAMEGGGEGRYFTGSRADPYACSVCHSGAEAPVVTITGLHERIEPGARTEVRIRWRESDASHALQLELANADGRHAELELLPLDELPRQQRCEQLETGEPAVYSLDVEQRRVLGVSDCGASELGFSFTAPDTDALYFSLAVVRSDGSGTPAGDGVLELRRRIGAGPPSDPAGCSATALAARGGGGLGFALACSTFALLWRRRALRRFAGVLLACGASGCYEPGIRADVRPGEAGAVPLTGEFDAILKGARRDSGTQCATVRSRGGDVSIRVRTISGEGRYRPRNVGAIWIAHAEGAWVKTLERWGTRRAKWLTAFNEASSGDVTDAITGPTLPMHRVHEVRWDRTDRDGCEVEDGDYQVMLEMTDWSGTGASTSLAFELSDEPARVTPEDRPPFVDLELRIE